MIIEGFGIPAISYTLSGLPSVDTNVLKTLCGDPINKRYGKLFDHFKSLNKEEEGKIACEAINNLIEFKAIETLL